MSIYVIQSVNQLDHSFRCLADWLRDLATQPPICRFECFTAALYRLVD